MSGDLDAQFAQLLHQPPHLRPAGSDLFCNLGPADNDGGVLGQQPHNPPQSRIRPLRCVCLTVGRGRRPARVRFGAVLLIPQL